MQVVFYHGALCDTYEEQANKQGFTLGDKEEFFQTLGYGLVLNHIHGILKDSQYNKALERLQKRLVKALKPLKESEENHGLSEFIQHKR